MQLPASPKRRQPEGFTLTELLVTIVVSLLILLAVTTSFILNQRVFRKADVQAELLQNARISLDYMTREIRQANEIVTVLPIDNAVPASVPHELEFEDGHTTDQIQYIRYFLEDTDLLRQTIVYSFSSASTTFVRWDDADAFGAPNKTVIDEKQLGEFFANLDFYGNGEVSIDLTLQKYAETFFMHAAVHPRNI